MRTTLRSLAISSLLLVLTAAASARTRPHYGGNLRLESAGFSDNSIAPELVTETLTSVDAMSRVQPALAEQWDSENGGRRWQFWIRSNVRFHDGSVLTAADVAQALNAKQGAPWRSVRASGSSAIFDCDDAQPLLPSLLSLPQFGISKADASGNVIGTGPYRETSVSGNTTRLVAFDDYWRGRPYVDSIDITSGRGLRDQWLDLSVGRADVVEVPAEQIRRAQQERMRTLVSRNMELLALVPVTNSPALQDGRMRQAVAAAIDRSTLLNVIFQKQGEAASAILPNWMTGYDFLFPAAQNLTLARDLRGQSKQASAITIAYEPADATQQLVADRVALNGRDAGIAMQSAPRGKTQTDFDLLRISLSSPNPSIALHQVTAWFLPGDSETVNDDLTTLFKDESELLSSGKVIPLLYVPKGVAASQRVHNWSVDWDGAPAIAQFWVEDRR